MAEKGTKAAIGVGAAAVIAGVILLATRAEAKPPPPPEPGLATLYGVVSDASTGKALSDVSVILWDAAGAEQLAYTQTGGRGNYSIRNILPGSYMVQFVKEGYETAVR